MKLVLFSDLHAQNQYEKRLSNGRNARLQDSLNVLEQVGNIASANSADAILFLGDLFHSRFNLDVDVISGVYSGLRELSRDRPIYLLRGNHDTYDTCGHIHSLTFDRDNIHVIEKPREWYLPAVDQCDSTNRIKVCAIPWQEDVQGIKQMLLNPHLKGDILLLHVGLKEGSVGPTDRKVDVQLSVNDLPTDRFRWIFLGDYHRAQEIIPGRVMYLGSPLQLSFGERNETKYITLLDTITGPERIESNAPKYFEFASVREFDEAVNAGTVNPDCDFIRVKYDKQELEQAANLTKEFETVKFEKQERTSTEIRCSTNVLRDDQALVCEQTKDCEGDRQILVDYGLEILSAIG